MVRFKFSYKIALVALIALTFFITSCSRLGQSEPGKAGKYSDSAAITETASRSFTSDDEYSEGQMADFEEKSEASSLSTSSKDSLDVHFVPKSFLESDRYLEYSMSMTFKTEKFLKSRKMLLDVVSKNGHMLSGSSAVNEGSSHHSTTFMVKKETLFDVLAELDEIGTLKSERISTVDHTPDMMWNAIKTKREAARAARRQKAVKGVGYSDKSFGEKERMLSETEDAKDSAEFSKWQIMDKVQWVKITVSVEGPEIEEEKGIRAPNYLNAFVGLVNVLLGLLYVLVYFIPFAVIALVIVIVLKVKKAGPFKEKE